MSILVWIDDHVSGVSLRKPILENCGYSVLTARTAREGLALLSAKPVQGVILECELPDMPGAALVQQIRAVHATVPVVVLSRICGKIPEEVTHGVDAIFTKSQDSFSLVVRRLGELINQRQQQA